MDSRRSCSCSYAGGRPGSYCYRIDDLSHGATPPRPLNSYTQKRFISSHCARIEAVRFLHVGTATNQPAYQSDTASQPVAVGGYHSVVADQKRSARKHQTATTLFPSTGSTEVPAPRQSCVVAPGALHVPDWLSVDEQLVLIEHCRNWAKPPAPMRKTVLPGGKTMSVQTVSLGWHWLPYRYSRFAEDVDGSPVDPFPQWLGDMGRRAIAATFDAERAAAYKPDCALINFYDDTAKMGLHQDKDERSDEPVVSLSIGDSCLFRFGNTETRTKPYTDVRLESGDLFVFGGPSRFAYHGVPKIFPGTANPELGMRNGRLNITIRVTGLTDNDEKRKPNRARARRSN
jgi:DNA oxidative demethylase